MEKGTHRDQVLKEVQALIASPSVYSGLKELAQAWLQAEGTADEAAATEKLVAELKADVQSIDTVLAIFDSPAGTKVFGAEQAAALTAQAKKVKAEGGQYCFCPACTAGKAVLDLLA